MRTHSNTQGEHLQGSLSSSLMRGRENFRVTGSHLKGANSCRTAPRPSETKQKQTCCKCDGGSWSSTCVSKDGEQAAASYHPLHLLQPCRTRQIFLMSLNIKASAVAYWVVCSDLSLHLLHPGHVPVPHRNTLLLPEQVGL